MTNLCLGELQGVSERRFGVDLVQDFMLWGSNVLQNRPQNYQFRDLGPQDVPIGSPMLVLPGHARFLEVVLEAKVLYVQMFRVKRIAKQQDVNSQI